MVRFASALVIVFGCGAPAWAQVASPPSATTSQAKWEFEVHVGGALGNQPAAGTPIDRFPAGETFATLTGRLSRYASTWFFGDGAALINQIAAGFVVVPVSARMAPLDPVLTKSGIDRRRGVNFGGRVARRLTPRWSAEFSVDSLSSTLDLNDAARSGLEASRASFGPVWNGIIATGGGVSFTNPDTSATLALTDGSNARQTILTGGVNFALSTTTRLVPYLTAGAGALIRSGDLPSATLTGNYRFTFGGLAPFNESDVVKVQFAAKDRAAVGLFGGGVKYALTPRQGLRVDVRVHTSPNSIDTLVSATPSRVLGTPAFFIGSATTPSLVFSNTSVVRSNLTGPAIADLKTFTGSGRELQTSLTVGYFLRFPSAPVAGAASVARTPRAQAAVRSGRKWEIEAHAGGGFGDQSTKGTPIGAFPPGEAFTNAGRPSRYASTWYFGDGTLLINQIAAQFTGTSAATTRMTALDPVLTAASLERSHGPSVGVRVSRRVTRLLSAELTVDSLSQSLTMTDTALQGLEATRASFPPMWNAILATGGTIFSSRSISSNTAIERKADSRRTVVTGAANVELPAIGRLVPYATAGAGVSVRSGDLPSATLTGNYQFRFLGTAPFNVTDEVTVRFGAKDRAFVGLFGGGLKYDLTPRQGLRADVRVHVSADSIDTLVDARPNEVLGTPTSVISSGTTPSLVFSNTSATRGNLTGPAITGLKTFTGSGRDIQTHLTIGYFVRF
jgi:hypothetical protein